jgi:DNA-binding CsgD family transcriptional regulator
VWAVSDPINAEDAMAALALGVPDVERHLAKGSIEILPGSDWYLNDGRFDLKRITGGWNEKLNDARARGYAGLRISGNAFWLGTDYWKDFRVYEEELDRVVAGQTMIVSCTYSLAESRATDVLDVARAHGVTIARRRGNWEFIETVRVPPNSKPLTPRELEVLAWVARGKSAWEIAIILGITKRTVDEHVHRATGKLGAANRTEAVAIATRDRIIGRTNP